MAERERRRWSRLRPDSLAESTTALLDGRRVVKAGLIDLSPGGIALELPAANLTWLQRGPRVRLRIGFRGIRKVELPARIARIETRSGGPLRVGFAWLQDPPPWSETERREFPRLGVSREDGFTVRVFNKHIQGLWTRATILDLSSDRGLRIESMGGPIWMLPGMTIDVHLDLPVIHETPLCCQVLWVRPDHVGKVYAGLRVLDLESPSLQALDEWIAISGLWKPRELVSRGFASPSIPGQYRFRTAEAIRDRKELVAHLDACTGRPSSFGFESLPESTIDPEDTSGLIGCWDGQHLVASIAFELPSADADPSSGAITLVKAGFELEWFDREILRGLWNQTLRMFIASGRPLLRIWCPPGRERLLSLLGMRPAAGTEAESRWYDLRRETILFGHGVSAFTWCWIYGEISSFHIRQGNAIGLRRTAARLSRIAFNAVFEEVALPSKKRRIGRELRAWCEEATSGSN